MSGSDSGIKLEQSSPFTAIFPADDDAGVQLRLRLTARGFISIATVANLCAYRGTCDDFIQGSFCGRSGPSRAPQLQEAQQTQEHLRAPRGIRNQSAGESCCQSNRPHVFHRGTCNREACRDHRVAFPGMSNNPSMHIINNDNLSAPRSLVAEAHQVDLHLVDPRPATELWPVRLSSGPSKACPL